MKSYTLIVVSFISITLMSQEKNNPLPYYEVPEYRDTIYTAGSTVARMIDGLGFRFYWATADLRPDDLSYKPNSNSRSTMQTMAHIYSLSKVILNSTLKAANTRDDEDLTYAECRVKTLNNLKRASDILKASDNLSEFTIRFPSQEYPFWNQINGPIADAIWHCGQIAANRRSSGNPINANINHFTGTVRK